MNVNRVLVATDFSSYSAIAVSRACELAAMFDADLHLVHVAHGHLDTDRRRVLSEQLGRSLDPHDELRLDVVRTILQGTAYREIVDYARQHRIDLIVIGTHGRTGLAHATLGSVAERVLRSAAAPVLVVKPDDTERDVDLWQAAQSLEAAFGNSLTGEHDEALARMKRQITQELGTSAARTDHLLQQLEITGVISYIAAATDTTSEDATAEAHWRLDISPLETSIEDQVAVTDGAEPAAASTIYPATAEAAPAYDLIQRAAKLFATDIHIDPVDAGRSLVRFRIDGGLEDYCHLDHDVADHLNRQLTMLANLDIADPFSPKEGRLYLPPSLADLEVRFTSSPVFGGEAIALRLFSRENVFFPLRALGLSNEDQAVLESMLQQREGLVLVTGPTGAGKTTTVYSMLEIMGTSSRNIVSIEDPVEFAAPFVRQMTVDERHGITMSSGLRTLLRMDPDIIFVGEIRDADTADVAMRAASSGRYVFSTLHTRDVAATVTALRDLHVDNRSLSGNLTGVVNQRLVRLLCPQCVRRVPITDGQRQLFAANDVEAPGVVCESDGCEVCRGTGFRGRIAVFETAKVDAEFARAVADGASEDVLRELLRSNGTWGVAKSTLLRVKEGITSYQEALTVSWI